MRGAGGVTPAALSAANEVAVDAFLSGRTAWTAIATTIDATLQRHAGGNATTLDDVLEADRSAREIAIAVLAAND